MELTTNHPASRYGVPVLIIDGIAYGALDRCEPSGQLAYDLVRESAARDNSLDKKMADQFLRSAPDLYFDL